MKKIEKYLYYSTLILLSFLVIFGIMFVKSQTVAEFTSDPFFVIFSFFVTLFVLSRLISAVFYNFVFTSIVSESNDLFEPHISFVIPCKNEEASIENNIRKCFETEYPKDKFEVIIINDGSTDRTIDVIRSMQQDYGTRLQVIDWKVNRGKRHAMAEGFRNARGEIVIQLDSDSFIEPQSVRKLIEPFRNPEIGAVCAHADPQNADINYITRMQAAYYYMSFRILKAAESTFMSVFCCSGCSSAFRKSVVLPIIDQWLGENFLGKPVTWGDDRSLTSWVLKLGYKTVYVHTVRAHTIVPQTWKQLYTQQLRWKKSWIINAIFTSKFIYKTNPFIALFYFFPLILIGFLTPILAFSSIIYFPLVLHIVPYYYILSVLLVTSLFVIFYRFVGRDNKYWPYLFLWTVVNIFFLSYVMFMAALKIQDRGWGTR